VCRTSGTLFAMPAAINMDLESEMSTVAGCGMKLGVALALALGVVACTSGEDGGAGGSELGGGGSGAGEPGGAGSGAGGSGAGGDVVGGGGAGGCSEGQPSNRGTCEEPGLSCDYADARYGEQECEAVVQSRCQEGQWNSESLASCGLIDAQCDPVGTWHVELTGPWQASEADLDVADYQDLIDSAFLPFDIEVTKNEDGQLLVDTDHAIISDDGCTVLVSWELSYWEEEIDGEIFSETDSQSSSFLIVGDVGTGEVVLECEGECGVRLTAPSQATRQ